MTAARKLSSRYDLDRCIAHGGMGAVYVGVQRGAAGFERQVAIKRTHAHLLEDPETREVILREARNASAVRHPNVVSIDDVEEIDGELLLVMEYIEGGSVASLARAGRIALPLALRIVIDAGLGLEAIHSARSKTGEPLGLVHRDVSPQNVLVGVDGVARMTDFGIAKGLGDPTRTSKAMRRGKFGYMSPEYIVSGSAHRSSDIFALGVVLWEMLAQRRLFDGESNIDTLRRTMACEVPSLRAIRKEVPVALDAVILKALAADPTDRHETVAAFMKALERCGAPIATHAEVAVYVRGIVQPRGHSLTSEDQTPVLPLLTRGRAANDTQLERSASRFHHVFRLEERISASERVETGSASGVTAAPTVKPMTVSPATPARKIVAARMATFCFVLMTSTAALAYVGLAH